MQHWSNHNLLYMVASSKYPYSQLLQLIPRGQFDQAVKQHKAERAAKGFTCWGQFVAMLFCQVAHMNSLREVCLGLACCEDSLKQLGLGATPNKSTLAVFV